MEDDASRLHGGDDCVGRNGASSESAIQRARSPHRVVTNTVAAQVHRSASRVSEMVTGRGPTTQEEASAAPDAAVECIGIDNLIGEGRLAFEVEPCTGASVRPSTPRTTEIATSASTP